MEKSFYFIQGCFEKILNLNQKQIWPEKDLFFGVTLIQAVEATILSIYYKTVIASTLRLLMKLSTESTFQHFLKLLAPDKFAHIFVE